MMGNCLKRYWFEFDFSTGDLRSYGYLPPYGCGITAYDYADALWIMRHFILRENELPKFSQVIENVDVSTLKMQNISIELGLGVPVWRGVWYPAYNLWWGAYVD